MRNKRELTEITCDWCGKQMQSDLPETARTEVFGEQFDVCPECLGRLEIIMNWKESKNRYVAISMNDSVSITLGTGGVQDYNKYYEVPQFQREAGDEITEQVYRTFTIFRSCPAQDIACPFEVRIPIKTLKLPYKEQEGGWSWN